LNSGMVAWTTLQGQHRVVDGMRIRHSLFDSVGKAGGYLDHIGLEGFKAGAYFVLRPQRNELAALDSGVGAHGVLAWECGC
jgi:hypothetical protein